MASVTIANAYVQIDPSFDGLARKLRAGLEGPASKVGREVGEKVGAAVGDGVESGAGKAGARAGDAITSGIDRKLRGGAGIAKMAAAVGFGALVSNAKNAASDLQQAIGATESVFGESAGKIDDWAKSAADAMGLSERAARESLNLIGSQFKNFGFSIDESIDKSKQLVELGADLAATFGGSTADAVAALSAVFRGEFDSIEKYGVSLKASEVSARAVAMGLAKNTTAVDRHAQAQATLAILTEQTADAQGQFAREADTAAGAQQRAAAKAENAAASMGQALLPVYAKVTEVVGAAAEVFARLPGPVQTGVVALAGIAALSGPLSGIAGAIGGIGRAAKGLSGLSTLSKVGLGLGAATLAVGAGFAIWDRFQRKQRELEANTRAVASALPAQVDETWRLAEASAGATGRIDGMVVAQKALMEVLTSGGGQADRLEQAMGALGIQSEDTLKYLVRMGDDPVAAMFDLAESMGLTARDAYLLSEALGRTDGSLGHVEAIFRNMATQKRFGMLPDDMLLTADAAEALWRELAPTAAALGDLEGAAKSVDISKIAREFLNQKVAASEAGEALVLKAEAEVGATRASEQAFAVYVRYNQLLGEMTPAQRALVTGMEDSGAATKGLGSELKKLEMKSVTNGFDRAADAASGFSRALDKVTNPAGDLEESNRRLREMADSFVSSLDAENKSLDINTAAGRNNREQIQERIDGLREHAKLMIADGASVEEATSFLNFMTAEMINNAVQAHVSEAEVRDYLATLGATPEQVATAIKLMGDEDAKRRVEEVIARLGDIPDPVRSQIQAFLDRGMLAEAEAAINGFIAKKRPAIIIPVRTGPVKSGTGKSYEVSAAASGAVWDRPTLGLFGEAGAEAVLPLTRPSDMARIVSDSRVRGPVLDALGARPAGGGGSFVYNQNAPVYGVQDLQAALDAWWRRVSAVRRFAT